MTRNKKAAQLIERLNRGPELSLYHFDAGVEIPQTARRMMEIEMRKQFVAWSQTWLIPDVCALVPELKTR